MVDGRNPFKIKNVIGQGDNFRNSCLLHYPHLKEKYKLITIDLNKQRSLDADPKAIK